MSIQPQSNDFKQAQPHTKSPEYTKSVDNTTFVDTKVDTSFNSFSNKPLNSQFNSQSNNGQSLADTDTATLSDLPGNVQKMQVGENDNSSFSYRYETWRNAVYEALIDADMLDDARRWLDCETLHRTKLKSDGLPPVLPDRTQYILVCSSNPESHPKIIQKHTCGLRYCPTCAEQHSARLVNRYKPIIESVCSKLDKHSRYQFRHIVLTTPYSLHDADIKEKYKQHQRTIVKLFDELLPDKWRKNQGLIVGDEFGEEGDKLHSHVLHYGQYIPKDKLTETYKKLTGQECEINYIKGVVGDTETVVAKVQEVLKYCTKFWREDEDGNRKMIDPYLIPKLASVLKGTRRIRTYGIFYNIPEPEQEVKECLCEVCDAPMTKVWTSDYEVFRQTGMTWQEIVIALNATLDLKTANKSFLNDAHIGDKPPPKQKRMPNFEAIHYHQTN